MPRKLYPITGSTYATSKATDNCIASHSPLSIKGLAVIHKTGIQ